ncbi:MAG: hypothetical protein Q8L56_15010 [Rhodocyclaceae bacterium]|nr:hypothetical protein [Rhodocyclaceae bacterium]
MNKTHFTDEMNSIDASVDAVREFFSECAIANVNVFSDFIVKHLGVNSAAEYDSILDSYYLLEDTQLAKWNFLEIGIPNGTKQNFGEAYLRMYGILNACYLQLQAIKVCGGILNIPLSAKQIHACELFDYRNCFGAHTPNRSYKDKGKQHSFILDRHALLSGKLSGYSSNSQAGHISKDADIVELISDWNALLAEQLEKFEPRIIQAKRML